MTQAQYLAQRKALLAKGQQHIDCGELEAFEGVRGEIEALDTQYEAAATARANLTALQGGTGVANLSAYSLEARGVLPLVSGEVLGAVEESTDLFASSEYRTAFMRNVIRGEAIPERFSNAHETTRTGDAGVIIPTPVMERIVENLEATGMILPQVTRTSMKGGVRIPTSSVKPVATWVAEGTGSDRQKTEIDYIEFAYHKLRCAVAMTLETETMALPVFEATFVRNVVEAMVKALEQSIVGGDGKGKPKGITMTQPNNGQALIATGKIDDLEKAEAALPIEYESGAVWCMTKKTFMHYATLKDSNGQPVGRTNYGGVTNRPERVLLGRQVVLCNYLPSLDSAKEGDVFAFLFHFSDYVLNTNYEMTLKKYEDNDTDDWITKAVLLADGKVADKGSLVTLKKGK